MKVRIHRGTEEVGGSCVEVEANGETLVVDAGLPLVRNAAAPPTPNIDGQALRAILISHPHLDHYGLLPKMPPAPVVMGAAARRIVQAAQPYMGKPIFKLDGPDMVDRKTFAIGSFQITPYLVDHSAYDSYALLIEAGGKRLFYSGDIRTHGRKHKLMEHVIAALPSDIDVVLLEGSTLGRTDGDTRPQTEEEIEDSFVQTFRETKGLALVHASAQNIDRIVSMFRACLKSGRTLLFDLYTAEVLAATENENIPQSDWDNIGLCIPQRQRIQIKRNHWFDALARHSSHRVFLKEDVSKRLGDYALLFRPLWMRDLDRANCLEGACLIHSQWEGYLKEERFIEIDAWRQKHGVQFRQIHTSGHVSPAELRRIATALSPKVVVPIHTSNPTAYDAFCRNVACYSDGIWWEV